MMLNGVFKDFGEIKSYLEKLSNEELVRDLMTSANTLAILACQLDISPAGKELLSLTAVILIESSQRLTKETK